MQATPEQQQVEDLHVMFPSIEKSVISLILEANQYKNELAVEALLQLSASPSTPPKSVEASPKPAAPAAEPHQKSLEEQIHEDERLAHALQLKLSGNVVNLLVALEGVSVDKAVQQLESDEALALSLQNEYFLQVENQASTEKTTKNKTLLQRNRRDSRSDEESEPEEEDIFDDMAKEISEAADKAAVKMEAFGKDVSNAWSTFTTVIGSKINETFNPNGGPQTPQLVVRTAPRSTAQDAEESKPFL